jgi:hypothetical protein
VPDEEKTETQKPEEQEDKPPPTQEDMDALRKEKDTQLAEQAKALKELSQSHSTTQIQLQELQTQIESAQNRVELDEDAPPEAKAAVKKLGDDLELSKRFAGQAFQKWADAASSQAALRLALEYEIPDQVDALTREFRAVAAKGEEALSLAVDKAEIKLMREKAETEKTKKPTAPTNYDENVQTGRTPTKVIDKIKAIDVTTSEGRTKWEEQRRALAKEAGVPVP